MTELDTLRERMDSCDRALVNAFTERMRISEDIARYKLRKGLPVLDSTRERAKLDSVRAIAGERFAEDTETLYRELMRLSRALQEEIIHSEGGDPN